MDIKAFGNRLVENLARNLRVCGAHVEFYPADEIRNKPVEANQVFIGQETLERYEAALSRLKDDDREAIILRVEFGCSYPDIVTALGKPSLAAAHMAVSRALVRLAEEMAHGRA